jgi:hypothetical protein
MILPPGPAVSMCRPAARHSRKTPCRLTSITAIQSSSDVSTVGPRRMMPALFTRMSRRPSAATVSRTSRSGVAGSAMSPTPSSARRPAPRTRAAVAEPGVWLPCTATSAPASARAKAMAAPMPREAPVTRATLPSRENRWSDAIGQSPEVEAQVGPGVGEADVANGVTQQLTVFGQEAGANIVAEEVAHDASVVLVPRIGQEAA